MFFKRLELFGFKSFAQKTKLDFEAGVTAIVGPNGCGKTNFVDAIKWVMGEQSVHSIRGARMEDVIFHGADSIPPVGFAEVSLTVSNTNKFLPLDYEEITITRRIFRSGESEYLINKIPVRLKDIADLLMGTGLGMPSYSLMEQGKVDQILSSRPEERRAIFEEASGITRYRSKKEEALRRLERTGENLQRIGDIIVEVKRQIKSIERQVNKARRYREEFEKLKEYELRVSQHQYQNLKKEKVNLENSTKEKESEEDTLSSRIDFATSTLEKTKHQLLRIEESISHIQSQNYEVCTTIKTAQNKISLDKERIAELTERDIAISQQIENLEKKIVQVSEQKASAQDQIKTIEQNRQTKTSLLLGKEESINTILANVLETRKLVTKDKTEEVEIIARKTRLKNELTKLMANLANFNARLRRLTVEYERTKEEFNDIEEKLKSNIEDLDSLYEQLKQLTGEIYNLKNDLDTKLEKKQRLDSRLQEINRQITSHTSTLNFLKEITQKYEGFSRGVRSILSALKREELKIDGLNGVVANLIAVSPQYQMPIEMVLGENAQAIIVENRQVACEIIDYLKEGDLGRASFICLDSLKANNKEKSIQPLPNSLGLAQEFIKTEPKYQRLIEYLLANTFIVQDIESARLILKDIEQPFIKLVTLNGEILTKTSIIGGSVPKNLDLSLLGRQERISETQAELERIKKERNDIENLKSIQDSEIKEIRSTIEQKESSLNKLKIKLANKESEKVSVEAEKKRFQDEMSVLNLEIDETKEQMQNLQEEEEELNQRLKSSQEKQEDLQQKIQDQQTLISENEEARLNILVEIAEMRAQISALDKEAEDAQMRLQMIVDSVSEQETAKVAREGEAKDNAVKIRQLNEEITQLKLQDKDLSQRKVDIEEELNRAIKERQRFSTTIKGVEDKARESQKQLDTVRSNKTNLQIRIAELGYKQDSLKDRMQQSYQVDLSAALEDALEISPPEDSIFDEINHLKARLEGMGSVNLIAIEENDQLQQRYSFLISQQEDLTSAQESLRRAITQINRTARTMFQETFEKIRVSFKEYFRILFGGGDVRLILLDENNILESGIEIVVRPPGKRLQNLSLLSGGEKALTAIALLFAIFKVKPSPFCILDEVDAPLDEANVDRFTNLLSEFIKTSQFIIITHNKKTINMADVMYGITMEKSGVSKIVSVRFAKEREVSHSITAE